MTNEEALSILQDWRVAFYTWRAGTGAADENENDVRLANVFRDPQLLTIRVASLLAQDSLEITNPTETTMDVAAIQAIFDTLGEYDDVVAVQNYREAYDTFADGINQSSNSEEAWRRWHIAIKDSVFSPIKQQLVQGMIGLPAGSQPQIDSDVTAMLAIYDTL